MRERWKKIVAGICAVCMISTTGIWFNAQPTEAKELVVVLDAGHDNVHVGASGNGLKEELLNLKITQACKAELETYEGVKVYLVRDSESCPYGGWDIGGAAKCNLKRVDFAVSVGADVYVALHNNSSESSSPRGTGVYYPTRNYNAQCGATGSALAQSIQDQLLTTGLHDRGIQVRYSEDNTRYPDGSLADYYGIIKNNKLKGIPAVIVEHAFLTNAQDVAEFLSTDEKLATLGKLDATGIARYYGLKKKLVLDYSKAQTTVQLQNDGTQIGATASGIVDASRVQFAVWSEEGGQNDLVWYDAAQDSNGNWTASIPLSKHATEGIYQIHTYADGKFFVNEKQLNVVGPTVQKVSVTTGECVSGTFKIQIQGVQSGTDIDSVSVAAWPDATPSAVQWIPAQKTGDGSYELTVNVRMFHKAYGLYQLHTYVRDNNGIVKCVDMQLFDMVQSQDPLDGLVFGDADYSGKVELSDAQIILRAALGIVELDEELKLNCDMDSDGRITLGDAQIILKMALGIL